MTASSAALQPCRGHVVPRGVPCQLCLPCERRRTPDRGEQLLRPLPWQPNGLGGKCTMRVPPLADQGTHDCTHGSGHASPRRIGSADAPAGLCVGTPVDQLLTVVSSSGGSATPVMPSAPQGAGGAFLL